MLKQIHNVYIAYYLVVGLLASVLQVERPEDEEVEDQLPLMAVEDVHLLHLIVPAIEEGGISNKTQVMERLLLQCTLILSLRW